MFPSSTFRLACDALASGNAGSADKEHLRILYLAARHGEAAVEEGLRRLLDRGQPVSATAVEQALGGGVPGPAAPEVRVEAVDLRCFDALLNADFHGA